MNSDHTPRCWLIRLILLLVLGQLNTAVAGSGPGAGPRSDTDDGLAAEACFDHWRVDTEPVRHSGALTFLDETRMFRTMIRNYWAVGTVNFAGHYVLASWGCGTGCQMYARVDTRTGVARSVPFHSSLGAEFRDHSRLLIMNPHAGQQPLYAVAESAFYLLEPDGFRALDDSELPAACESFR